MLFIFKVNEEPAEVIDFTTSRETYLPKFKRLKELLEDPENISVWHNSQFDRTVVREQLGIDLDPARIHDTMIQAYCHGLPGALDTLCQIMKVPEDIAKLSTGKELIRLFCTPNPDNYNIKRYTRITHPKKWREFKMYGRNDVNAMHYLYKKLPRWNYCLGHPNHKAWVLDQRINDRGIPVDDEFTAAAVKTVKLIKEANKRKAEKMTGGAIKSFGQRDAFLAHILHEYGVKLPDLRKETLRRRANDQELPEDVRRLIQARLDDSVGSTTKYRAMRTFANRDGRIRGSLQFAGAQRTGRWAGRGIQPQNLPRLAQNPEETEHLIQATKDFTLMQEYDRPVDILKGIIRGAICAPEGYRIAVADLSNIEGRMAAWIAGETWKIKAFRDFDNGIGHDLYKIAYGTMFGVDPSDVNSEQRQIGKVAELAMGYEGGVGAFCAFAEMYSINLKEMARNVKPSLDAKLYSDAEYYVNNFVDKYYGLDRETFIVCDTLKRMWRKAHPAITSFWKELKEAAAASISRPGIVVPCGKVQFKREGAWLQLILPSGDVISYPAPSTDDSGGIKYKGIGQYNKKWEDIHTYGGKLFENICQSLSCDVMIHGIELAELVGLDVILTVHDEIVTEVPAEGAEASLALLEDVMTANPPWCKDLPLAAKGEVARRYAKD